MAPNHLADGDFSAVNVRHRSVRHIAALVHNWSSDQGPAATYFAINFPSPVVQTRGAVKSPLKRGLGVKPHGYTLALEWARGTIRRISTHRGLIHRKFPESFRVPNSVGNCDRRKIKNFLWIRGMKI